jgi:hypothetical protein
MAAGCGLSLKLSTRGRWNGPGICNEKEGGLARDATWREAPYESGAHHFRAVLEAALFVLCNIQHDPGGSSNSITVTENTDERPTSERPGRAAAGGQRECYAPVVRRGLANASVQYASFRCFIGWNGFVSCLGMCACALQLNSDQDPMDHYVVMIYIYIYIYIVVIIVIMFTISK